MEGRDVSQWLGEDDGPRGIPGDASGSPTMSLLMYSLHPDGVSVWTDTLATTPAGVPAFLVSKATALPHLGAVVAVTGALQVGTRWVEAVTTSMVCRDFGMLDRLTPDPLRGIAKRVAAEFGPITGTSTVYHFGYSDSLDQYVGFAYRSTNDYASERLPDGSFGVKPHPTKLPSSAPAATEDVVELATTIRREQEALAEADRIHIGGDLVLIHMEDRVIAVAKVHRFDDFERQWLEMNVRLNQEP